MSNDGHFPSIFGRVQATQISGGKKKKKRANPAGTNKPIRHSTRESQHRHFLLFLSPTAKRHHHLLMA